MKATIAPRHWIAPRVSPEFAHDFPIELGATRLFGEIKPWAPSFSYGLVIELNDALMPVGSAHSRADGRRHAISDALIWNGDLDRRQQGERGTPEPGLRARSGMSNPPIVTLENVTKLYGGVAALEGANFELYPGRDPCARRRERRRQVDVVQADRRA